MNKAFLNVLRFKLLSNLQTLFVINFFGSEDFNIFGLYKPRSALKNVSDKSNDKISNIGLKTKNKLLRTRLVRKQRSFLNYAEDFFSALR